ncbi:hypothetical protein PS2_006036 [Malus domestica]
MSVEIECLDVELDYERSKKVNEIEFGNPYVRRNFEKLPAEIQFQILEREEEVGFLFYIQVFQILESMEKSFRISELVIILAIHSLRLDYYSIMVLQKKSIILQ